MCKEEHIVRRIEDIAYRILREILRNIEKASR